MTRLPTRFNLFVVSVCLILFACHAVAERAHAQTFSRPQLFLKMQQTDTNDKSATTPAANPADVKSLDAILAAVYDSISGAKGKPRNWDRFRSLFIPGARLIPTGKRPTGEFVSRVLTPEEFIKSSGKFMEEQGFFEHGIANHIETFGNIAQVFSVYEGRHDTSDAKPFVRGINSIQLMNDGKRWWVVTIFWQAEDAANPLPKKYLTARKK